MPILSNLAARQMLLAAQGLLHPPAHPAAPEDVKKTILQLSALQIDTINVVARSPYLVLWSRLGNYEPSWLDDLLASQSIFEYWSHAACFLPVEDYPLYRRMMLDKAVGGSTVKDWFRQNQALMDSVLEQVRTNGPVRSSDFEQSQKPAGGWWNWKAEKIALEHLLTLGELMIARREKFQRVYDLRERVLPTWKDESAPAYEQIFRQLILKSVKAMGISQAAWVPDYFHLPKREVADYLSDLITRGELFPVEVEGWKTPGLVHPDNFVLLEQASTGVLQPEKTTFLSPFDSLIWDRTRTRAVFDFNYSIECYLPVEKRVYGYFSMPILYRDRLVGRLSPKAHRKEKILEIKSFHLEPGVTLDEEMLADITRELKSFATWNKTPTVQISQSNPPEAAEIISRFL